MSRDIHPQQAETSGPPQFVEITMQAGVLTAGLIGPVIGQREGPIIADELIKQIEIAGSHLRLLVLDLSDVLGMSSMGLGMCIEVRNRAKAHHADTVLFGVNDELMGLIRMVKVDRLYHLANSDEELASLIAA